jgi:hypothetical protein
MKTALTLILIAALILPAVAVVRHRVTRARRRDRGPEA